MTNILGATIILTSKFRIRIQGQTKQEAEEAECQMLYSVISTSRTVGWHDLAVHSKGTQLSTG